MRVLEAVTPRRRGRPRVNDPRVAHVRRPDHKSDLPLLVTLTVEERVSTLRSRRSFRVIERAFWGAMEHSSARICHFGVRGKEIVMIIEAADRAMVTAAMRSLGVRVGKGMNRVMGTRGRVVRDRYRARPLRTPAQVRRALDAVLHGQTPRHDGRTSPPETDRFSSAARRALPAPVTWLLGVGWCHAASAVP
jgi:hypothetical protein